MAKRLYVCGLLGSGTQADPYRPQIADYDVNWATVIPTDAGGAPRFAWCLVIVSAADQTTLLADARLDAFPNVALSTTVGELSASVRNNWNTRLQARGIDTSGITLAMTIGQVLRYIGRQLDSAFDEVTFDAA